MAKVSIIVPIYNCEKYIERFVLSVLNQTLTDIEVIFVDDKSPDKSFLYTKQIVSHDSRVKFIESDRNCGPMIARKKGYEFATGEYLFFADSDDSLPLNALELLYNVAINDGADIVSGTIEYFKIDSTSQLWRSLLPYGNDRNGIIKSLLLGTYRHNLCAKLFKRNLFVNSDLLNVENMRYFEDYLIFYQIVNRATIFSSIPDVVYNYYQNEGSSTQLVVDKRRISECYFAYSYVLKMLMGKTPYDDLLLSYFQKAIMNQYLLGYNKDKILDELVKEYGFSNIISISSILRNNNFLDSCKIIIGFTKIGRFLFKYFKK